MTDGPTKDAGYVLLDALVGIALGGLVMSFVAIGLRQISAVETSLKRDAQDRRETLSMLSVLRQWSEATIPGAEPGRMSPDDAMVFHRALPDASSENRIIEAKVGIEPFGFGANSRLILTIQNPQGPTERIDLFKGSQMALTQAPVAGPFISRVWTLVLRREPSMAPFRVQVIKPAYARPRCIAEPYLKECLP
jgi:hypothetical protein